MKAEPHAAPLDRFIQFPDVRERFETTIRAPAALVMDVAANFDMQSVLAIRGIFRLREWILGAKPERPRQPQGILDETKSLGWGVLEESPGRAVVCGATCQPWLAEVRFSSLDRERFAGYAEPGRVRIAWTMEAEEIRDGVTRFAQETRAVATDEEARRKFLRYWRWARYGIVAIRLLLLPAIRRKAEKQWAIHRRERR